MNFVGALSNDQQHKAKDAEIARLRAVLEPFAKGAKEIPDSWPDTRALLIGEKHPDNPKKHSLLIAYVKDFRAAQAALKE